MPEQVFDAVSGHLQLETEMGAYEAAEYARDKVEHVYDAAGKLFGCQRDEIAFVENATRAWDMAFYSLPFNPGDRILTCASEYASNYIAYLQIARRCGVQIDVIPNDEYGQVSVSALRKMLDEHVKLISITHVPTNGGLVNPAAAIGEIARSEKITYLLDACQSVGQMPIDVNTIGCDMLSVTGRKYLRAPRGTGLLYVRREVLEGLEPPFLDLHAATWVAEDRFEIRPDARRFENWETNVAGKIGMGVAIDYALSWGMDNIWTRISHLSTQLRSELDKIPHIAIRDLGKEKCGIVTFTVDGQDPQGIRRKLAEQRVNVSISLPEYTRIDMDTRDLKSVIRASVHYYNTEDEIGRFCHCLKQSI